MTQAGFTVVEASDAAEALAKLDHSPPALVVLDVMLPRVSGYELLLELRDRLGDELPVIFVSGERIEAYDRIAGLLLGADEYLVKPFDLDELIALLRRSLRPRHDAGANSHGPLDDRVELLTTREREVLCLLASGRASSQIADELVISRRTVATHVHHILAKLGASSRTQAVAIAHEAGLMRELATHEHVRVGP